MNRLAAALPLSLLVACGSEVPGETPDAGPGPRPDAPPTGEVCASLHAAFDPIVPTVMLVVDRSGSMKLDYGGVSRWDALYSTLMAPGTGAVAQLADKVRFGLLLYSGHDGNPSGACPTLRDVGPALDNYAAIDAVYGPSVPGTGTPTGAAMRAAAPALAAVTEPGPKLLILATDGEPDNCAEPSQDSSPAARGEVIAAVQAAHGDDMKTYVIGVGADVSESHLQEVANAGRGLPTGGPDNATYYRALDTASLVAAFDEIISGARGCVFELDGRIDGDVVEATVTLDGQVLDRGTDWQIRDGNSIELLGAACESVLAGGSHVVEATFVCDITVE
jgi:hypothetical protein